MLYSKVLTLNSKVSTQSLSNDVLFALVYYVKGWQLWVGDKGGILSIHGDFHRLRSPKPVEAFLASCGIMIHKMEAAEHSFNRTCDNL